MSGGPVEPGFLKDILDYAWILIAALVGALWTKHNAEVREIKDDMDKKATKDELERRSNERDKQFAGFRIDIKELFDRDDELKDHFTSKIDALRKDIHDDLNRVIDEVRKAK